MKKTQEINPNSINNIPNTTKFIGEIVTESDIKFDGFIKGALNTKKKLVLGESGVIEGNVTCNNAIISGKITGDIFVEDLVTFYATAKITGNITCNKISVEPGALINGKCIMSNTDDKTGKNKKEDRKEKQNG